MRIKTYTKILTGKRKALLGFVCPECGKRQILEYEFSDSEMAGIGMEEARCQVNAELNRLDEENKKHFNNMYDYMVIKSPVKCKECRCIQPWSDMTDNPNKPMFSAALGSAAVVFAGVGLYGVIESLSVMGFILLLISGIIYLIGKAKLKGEMAYYNEAKNVRSENIAKFVSAGNELPRYYRLAEEEIPEIMSGPYANEFAEFVKKNND